MSKDPKKERIKYLTQTLNAASKAYYADNTEILSNYEFDKLYDELVALESELGVVEADSPTINVGFGAVDSLSKVAHEKRILSLDKTKEIDALRAFLGERSGLLWWKLDGLHIVLKYENGHLIRATTRGNGEIGEDVTHNAKHFDGVPANIDFGGSVRISGEAVISYSEFERINEKLDDESKYKNPRNLCSGTVRQLDSKILKERRVSFYAFNIDFGEDSASVPSINSKQEALDWAKSYGFIPIEYKMVYESDLENATAYFKANVHSSDLPTDGLVLTFDDIAYSKSLGATAKFPKDSIAFKWEDEIARTKLIKIEWNTSRTGLINPVAIFEPVELEGTTVERASLHNLSIVKALELGISDEITVYKANMIIPQVADNLSRTNTFVIPSECDVCGFKTEVVDSGSAEFLYCKNSGCAAQLKHTLVHFVSRNAMNIEGLSEASIERFIEHGFLVNYLDIFDLESHKDDIMQMEGFGKKSAEKLLGAIEKSKTCTLHNFIYSLGINQIGVVNAKLLCAFFAYDFERIIDANEDELLEIDGFGPVMAKSVVEYFANAENRRMARDAYKVLDMQKAEQKSGELDGQTFVITGSLNHFANRGALSDYIENLGGRVASSVSANTTYLINNDATSGSGKNKKAKELGVSIITEEEFMERFGG